MTETISETMDTDWEAEWDDLSKGEEWVAEMHLAGSTQKVVQPVTGNPRIRLFSFQLSRVS